MINKIKNKLNKELFKFIRKIDKLYALGSISPLLFENIKEFILRDGKRVRPLLFVIGYKAFAKKIAANLYTSALAIELLHDFMLVHDDIIDKSATRRGKPSMHEIFNSYLAQFRRRDIKFNGQDLALIIGDVMYAMSIHAFLSIKENMERKEIALKKFIKAAMYTGSGEFIELINGIKPIEHITKNDIFKVYDYKTAYYTFACPLSTGAILGGANNSQIENLFDYGIYLGRAFQIKDDILGMFSEEKETGKSSFSDLQESKKTLLIWYAYKNSGKKDKRKIKLILQKIKVKMSDLLAIREIVIKSGALNFSQKEISLLIRKSSQLIEKNGMKPLYRNLLQEYCNNLIQS